MSRIIHRQLIGHEDFALGHGEVTQKRGPETLQFQQVEIEWIFRTVDEIKALDYNVYTHVAIHNIPEGPVTQYYYSPDSHAVPDDYNIIKPNSVALTQGGRYIRVPGVGAASLLDTIIASASDETTPLEVGVKLTTFRAPYPLTLAYVRCSLTNPVTDTELIVPVQATGLGPLFSTPMHIDVGETTSVTAVTQSVLSIVNIPDDQEFTVDVSQAGGTASGLKVAVTGTKVP
jgi:hypothetical protein